LLDRGRNSGEIIVECGCWGADRIGSFPQDHNCKSGSVCLAFCVEELTLKQIVCPPDIPTQYSYNPQFIRMFRQSFPQNFPYEEYAWICGPCQ
jgi:hypothetical protein